MTEQDIQAWEREINHAQMMYRLSYKHECERRHEKMRFNEAIANESMAATIEQDRLDEQQYQARLANEAARQRKHGNNMRFWHSIKSVVFVIICAAVAIRVLIHFAEKL